MRRYNDPLNAQKNDAKSATSGEKIGGAGSLPPAVKENVGGRHGAHRAVIAKAGHVAGLQAAARQQITHNRHVQHAISRRREQGWWSSLTSHHNEIVPFGMLHPFSRFMDIWREYVARH